MTSRRKPSRRQRGRLPRIRRAVRPSTPSTIQRWAPLIGLLANLVVDVIRVCRGEAPGNQWW